MPEVTARGLRFHVQEVGPPEPAADAPVVAFVHGLAIDNLSSYLYTLAGPLARAGAHCVLYDLRGHGLSERPATGYTVADGVADLFGVLDALGHRRPVHLVANSFGGAIALSAALARPGRVAGLVMVEGHGLAGPAGDWNEDMLNTLGRSALSLEYDRTADRLMEVGWRRQGRQAATADALVNGTSLLDDLACVDPVPASALAGLACPVLAVYGEHSEIAAAGRLLFRHAPDCTLHEMAGYAHTVLTDGTRELLDVMLPWLARRAGLRVPVEAR
jgi:pimeloyl-ACP methyl ester carboxylesterase